ncbi:MAG: MBL fold metallo-hydrolase [Nitrospina sp.]|nr:MBL fold metallo-hydrolase [Nitrospina sp.]MBT3415496.1 MBL fold metallo-hydrolase [Nitrospina sp.]MBT3855855.1 MBL fold metallo-hydrolase [Nitrospina sp.]MBT4104642.1 MBL fold metallo-hydrolase [Nitrospina sp.]MBT4389269.1 MBL fold metallo-hydrolase [Nitrospina sp.]
MASEEVEGKLVQALQKAKPEDLADEGSIESFVQGLPHEVRGTFGGNSSCVTVQVGDELLIFDAGSGIRMLGQDLMATGFGRGQGKAHMFFSHTHWDHILGIPFFVPFYIKGNQFTIHSPLPDIKKRLEGQQNSDYFPIPFSIYASDIDFVILENKTEHKIGDMTITWKAMYHPGKCFAYRVDYNGKSVVYATDAEYKKLGSSDLKPAFEFFRDADLLIFDSMYTFSEGLEKEDWGHSSTFIGVDLAVEANVKQIAFFHHEPTYNDAKLVDIFRQTEKYLKLVAPKQDLKMFLSYEGLTVDLLR